MTGTLKGVGLVRFQEAVSLLKSQKEVGVPERARFRYCRHAVERAAAHARNRKAGLDGGIDHQAFDAEALAQRAQRFSAR